MVKLSTSQLARRCGLSAETLRFYLREGLLPEPPRGKSGYREYGQQHVERIQFIVRSKSLGFTLREVRELVRLSDDPVSNCNTVRAKASEKLRAVRAQLEELEEVRQGLEGLLARCHELDDVPGCPILAALTDSQEPGSELDVGPGDADPS